MTLLPHFLGDTLYLQLSPERLTIRNPRTGTTLAETPDIALTLDAKPKIVAIGAEAIRAAMVSGVRRVNPFNHPRSLVSDFTLGEQVLKAFIRRIQGDRVLAAAPRVVFHLLGEPAGGFTQVEIRALREMAIGAGASKVTLWQGTPLSDQQLLSGTYPDSGAILD